MKRFFLLDIILNLFDGGAGAAGGGDGAGAAASSQGDNGAKGDSKAAPGITRRGNKSGEFSNVLFGKQPASAAADGGADSGQAAQSSVAGSDEKQGVVTTSSTLEERKKAYRDLVNGEYKDLYTEDTQRIINRRFRETQNLEQQVNQYKPVIDLLMQRYKIEGGDMAKLTTAIENDNAYWTAAAEEAGMNVEQYKQFQKLQRDNAALLKREQQRVGQQAAQQQLQKWQSEAEQVKGVYASFDLSAEVQNPQFMSMLKAGTPMQHAYEVIHLDEIKAGVAQMQAKATEKQVVAGIRAKGARPAENGTSSQSAFTVKDDPSKWSKKDRAEVAKRVMRGEKVYL